MKYAIFVPNFCVAFYFNKNYLLAWWTKTFVTVPSSYGCLIVGFCHVQKRNVSFAGWNLCSCCSCTACTASLYLTTLDWNVGRNLTIYLFYQKTTNPRRRALLLVIDRYKRTACLTQGRVRLRINIKSRKVNADYQTRTKYEFLIYSSFYKKKRLCPPSVHIRGLLWIHYIDLRSWCCNQLKLRFKSFERLHRLSCCHVYRSSMFHIYPKMENKIIWNLSFYHLDTSISLLCKLYRCLLRF